MESLLRPRARPRQPGASSAAIPSPAAADAPNDAGAQSHPPPNPFVAEHRATSRPSFPSPPLKYPNQLLLVLDTPVQAQVPPPWPTIPPPLPKNAHLGHERRTQGRSRPALLRRPPPPALDAPGRGQPWRRHGLPTAVARRLRGIGAGVQLGVAGRRMAGEDHEARVAAGGARGGPARGKGAGHGRATAVGIGATLEEPLACGERKGASSTEAWASQAGFLTSIVWGRFFFRLT